MSLTNEQRFLRELGKLSKKYDLYVGGCGCFGSPFLADSTGQVVVEDVTHFLDPIDGATSRYTGKHPASQKRIG